MLVEKDLKKRYVWVDEHWQPGTNTVAYRPLTSTTTVNDQSGNNYTLTQIGNGNFTTTGGVDCFYNSGSTPGYFNLTSAPKIPSGNADRTISLWVKPTTHTTSYDNFFMCYGGSNSGTRIFTNISSSQNYRAGVFGTAIDGGTMPINSWSLVTFTSSGNNFYLYANGVLQSSGTATINTTAVSSSYPFRLMNLNTSQTSDYKAQGYLSEVIIEDKAWTATEIANYFNDNKSKYGL